MEIPAVRRESSGSFAGNEPVWWDKVLPWPSHMQHANFVADDCKDQSVRPTVPCFEEEVTDLEIRRIIFRRERLTLR